LWNFTPFLRMNSYVSPSLDAVHDSARLGVLSPAGIGFTSASWIAYSTMNGLMNASVSEGSSHFPTRVTWSPQVIVPSGAAAAGLAQAGSSTKTASATIRERTRNGLMGSSSWGGPPRAAGGPPGRIRIRT
jgi:hypothetical protein